MEQNTFAEVQSQPAASSSPESVQEKRFTQGDLDALAGRVRSEERAAAEKRFQQSQQIHSMQPNNTFQVMPTNTVAANNLTVDQVERIAAEAAQKHQKELLEKQAHDLQMQEGMRIAHEFKSKLDAGKSNYSDFDQVVGTLPFANIPHIVGLANSVDNTADVMYELGNNPTKIATLTQLMAIDPQLARNQVHQLSDSIKKNQEAKQQKQANEPLSRTQPSPIGVDNGSMTVRDYQKMFANRR